MATDVVGLINFTSNVFYATISLLSFLCCCCWWRDIIAEGEDNCSLLKVVVAAGWFYCFVCCWRLRAMTLWTMADEDLLMAWIGWHWLRSCCWRRFTAAGVGNLLLRGSVVAFEGITLWTRVGEDLLRCLPLLRWTINHCWLWWVLWVVGGWAVIDFDLMLWRQICSGRWIIFFIIRTVGCFFLDQPRFRVRVKHKHVGRLIVRTIKTHALIPNLIRDNE